MKKQKSKRWLLFILAGIAAIAAALHIYLPDLLDNLRSAQTYDDLHLRCIYGAGDLPDFSFLDFFACKSTDPYMGNLLSVFTYYNCADSIMHFHEDTGILKNVEYLEYFNSALFYLEKN